MKFNARSSRPAESRDTSALQPSISDSIAVVPSNSESPQQNKGALLFILVEELQKELKSTRSEIGELRNDFQEVAEQQGVQHRMFDALHTELSDYKNDFVSARMKPMLSALLFLYDAIDAFHGEIEDYVDPPDWLGERVLKKELIQSNMRHFQEQFNEVLRMCELQPIAPEIGEIADAKIQNIVATEATEEAELNNQIQKVVRTGWNQGDKTFRAADVVVWKTAS